MLMFDGFINDGDSLEVAINEIPFVDYSGLLFTAEESSSKVLLQGLEGASQNMVRDTLDYVIRMTSLVSYSESILEITLKDVINVQSVRPLSAEFSIKIRD